MSKKNSETVSLKVFQTALQNYGYVMGLAARLAPFPGLADDIAQDVFVEYVKEVDQEKPSDVTSLLYRLTQRVAKRYYRDRLFHSSQELREIAEILAEKGQSIEEEPRHEAELLAMKECIEQLSPKSREMVQEHYFNNESLSSIAGRKNIRPGTLRQIMTRIRRQLKECVNLNMRFFPRQTEQF